MFHSEHKEAKATLNSASMQNKQGSCSISRDALALSRKQTNSSSFFRVKRDSASSWPNNVTSQSDQNKYVHVQYVTLESVGSHYFPFSHTRILTVSIEVRHVGMSELGGHVWVPKQPLKDEQGQTKSIPVVFQRDQLTVDGLRKE